MKQLFKDKKYWKDMGNILLFGIVINVACFFMCSMTGHCANGVGDNPYFPMIQNSLNVDDSLCRETLASNGVPFEHPYYFIMYNNSLGDRLTGYVLITDYEVTAEMNNDGVTFNMQNGRNFRYFGEFEMGLTGAWCNVWTRDINTLVGLNFGNDVTWNYVCYTSNYQVNFYVHDFPCLLGPDNSINIGDYTDLPPLDEILNNLTDTYTPDFSPVYPNIDNNKTDLENEKSFFDTLSQGITQNFNNLGANLQKFFNKIQQKLTDVANSISTNIHNGFATLMQNIRDFFGPKLDKIIELLTALVNDDESDVIETWEDTQLYSDFDQLSQTVENGFGVWQDTSEPNTYKIAFHVEQIPLLHCDEVQYIDLGLFSPVIPYIRSIMWALMVYSVFYTVIDSIANYLNGGDE